MQGGCACGQMQGQGSRVAPEFGVKIAPEVGATRAIDSPFLSDQGSADGAAPYLAARASIIPSNDHGAQQHGLVAIIQLQHAQACQCATAPTGAAV